jgi:hypothetical protein
MSAAEVWDWSLRIFDPVCRRLRSCGSTRRLSLQRGAGRPGLAPGYYAACLLDPDSNDVEALYRDVGNIGHGTSAELC